MADHKLVSLDDVAKMAAAGHSAFSPSSSKMWLTCAGSLIPNIMAEDHASPEAAEGTVAHAMAETWLTKGRRAAKRRIGDVVTVDNHDIEITAEMIAFVGDYVDYIAEIEDQAVESLTETRVDFSDLTPIPDQGGTADHIAVIEKKFSHHCRAEGTYKIVVTDLKFGKGIRVVAEKNTQGLLYAYGAYRLFKDRYLIDEIEIRIAHPRLHGGFTEWSIGVDKLLEFAELVKVRAKLAWRFDAERTPSEEGCQWCKVPDCAARYQWLAEVTSGVFDEEDDDEIGCVVCENGGCDLCRPKSYSAGEQQRANEELEDDFGPEPFKPFKPARLSTAALAKTLRYRKMMEKFFASVEEELLARAFAEEDIPGWKLVEGRTIRRWPDEIDAYKLLKKKGLRDEQIYQESIISPAEAEKKLHAKAGFSTEDAAKVVNSLAVKPRGNRSLARASDNREAALTSSDVFDDDN